MVVGARGGAWASTTFYMECASSSAPINTTSATNSSNTTASCSTDELFLGVFLTLAGAVLLALSMVVQRFALSHPKPRICGLPRDLVWFFGLVIYGAANACKIVAQPYGPWSVLASVWTTLLVWNLLIARLALKEQITIPKALGSLIILCGAVLCVVGTPPQAGCDAGVKTTFSSCEFASLLSAPAAAVWLALLLLCVLASIPTILFFERRYPLSRSGSQTREASPDIIAGNELMPVGVDDVQVAARKPAAAIEVSSACSSQPPRRLDALMAVVYPCSLGLDEGVADLLIKGWSAMLAQCSGPQHLGCSHPILWTSMLGWVLAAFGSAFWWMRKVFRRYETTVALPVEYGSLNAANVCTGLLFYAEHERMSGEQIALILCGLCVILVGIGVGTLSCWGGRPGRRRRI